MKTFTSNKTFRFLSGLLFFALLWQILAVLIGQRTFIFPGPLESFRSAFFLLQDAYVWKCIGLTMLRMLEGFGLSFLLALVTGVIAGEFPFCRDLFAPTVTALRSVPTASLVYLFLVLSGVKDTPLYIVILICFPILYESVLGGYENIPRSILEALTLDGKRSFLMVFKGKLPLAFPYIAVGMASSFTLSFKIEIMAEVITGYTRMGLGSAILAAQRSDPTNMVPVFGYSLIAVGIMLIIDLLVRFLSEKLLIKYE